MAEERLKDADALLQASRWDGSRYLCGYAVELALKARVCANHKLSGLPETHAEFSGKKFLKVHNLVDLLQRSGREPDITANHIVDWSIVSSWDPESRYRAPGAVNETEARDFYDSAKNLLGVI